MTDTRTTEVCVVGAGLAGLACAEALRRAGRDVVVLEARERVGGRVEGVRLDGGQHVELGGQWLGPTQERAYTLAAELGLATYATHDAGQHVLRLRGRRRTFSGAIPQLPPHALADLARACLALERRARRVPLAAPWEAPDAARLDAVTLATWLRRNLVTADARRIFELAVSVVFGTEPANLSLLHALFYVRGAGGIEALIDVRGGAQQDRVVGGSQQLPERLAASLGETVALSQPVRAITQDEAGVRIRADGLTVAAAHAVVAVPPTLAGRIAYDPPLPATRDQLTQRLPHGAVIKCLALYDEPFWREQGLSGRAMADEPPVFAAFDNTPASGAPGVLLAFVEGRHALELGRWTPSARRGAVLGSLARFFGPRAAVPEAYLERDWQTEEWTRGCYGAHHPPGAWTQLGHALRDPVGRLHWAGTETATVWAGYMEGALESGARAAAEVLRA